MEVAFRSPLKGVSSMQHQYKLFVMFSFILFLLLSCAFQFSLCLQNILLTSWLKSSFPVKRVWPDFHIWNLQNHVKYLKIIYSETSINDKLNILTNLSRQIGGHNM